MANKFYVQPAGDYSQGLSGLADVMAVAREDEEQQAALRAEEEEKSAAEVAMLDAFRSGDANQMYEVAIQHPLVGKTAFEHAGMLDDRQKQEGVDFALEVLSNPDRAAEITERRLQNGMYQNRDMKDTSRFYQNYLQDPENALIGQEMWLAAAAPESYKALLETRKGEEVDSKVVGDYLVNAADGNVIFDGSGATDGTPEHGVTPMFTRDAQGNYRAYLPNQAGGTTGLSFPEGESIVPDAGRMGYNPTNILERSAAETEAERVKQLPAQQRALLRRQQQATLMDDTIDRAKELTSNWSTGFVGNALKALPGSDAADLKQLLETVKGNIGFDKIQEMREASPTGGALGQVSNFELENLQSVIGNLEQSQSKAQFEYNLEQVRNTLRDIVHGSEQQFLDTYGDKSGSAAADRGQPVRVYNQTTGEFE